MSAKGLYGLTTDRNDVYDAAKFWNKITLDDSMKKTIILIEILDGWDSDP